VHFPRIFFQDFPGPGILKKKNPGLSRRRGNPAGMITSVITGMIITGVITPVLTGMIITGVITGVIIF